MKRRLNSLHAAQPRGTIGERVLRPRHRVAVLSLQPRPGDRIWLTTEFGGALFTRYPIGPRGANGRASFRVRRRHPQRSKARKQEGRR
jgi:hypothetical protein